MRIIINNWQACMDIALVRVDYLCCLGKEMLRVVEGCVANYLCVEMSGKFSLKVIRNKIPLGY